MSPCYTKTYAALGTDMGFEENTRQQGPFASAEQMLRFDRQHVWHPYAEHPAESSCYLAAETEGVHITLEDGRKLIDGMASWWTAIHGYRYPRLVAAAKQQLDRMPHVMFGGLSHKPAIALAERLLKIVPSGMEHVFFVDSGSVAIQVAMKMAVQYWRGRGALRKSKFATIRGGYHGDLFPPMSLCDPVNGMHSQFEGILPAQYFVDRPLSRFGERLQPDDGDDMQALLADHASEIAAVVLEPIVQGAGGMHFYSPEYLRRVKALCEEHDVLLILDEIATGFYRTGKMFAAEYAGVEPDILCVGKALSAGMMSLAATLCSSEVADTIKEGPAAVLMHGPTYMGNPLACAIASENLDILGSYDVSSVVGSIEDHFKRTLPQLRSNPRVADVRVLGAIAVVEMKEKIDVPKAQAALIDRGVWLRPFGKLLYSMPPYVCSGSELEQLTVAIVEVVDSGATVPA